MFKLQPQSKKRTFRTHLQSKSIHKQSTRLITTPLKSKLKSIPTTNHKLPLKSTNTSSSRHQSLLQTSFRFHSTTQPHLQSTTTTSSSSSPNSTTSQSHHQSSSSQPTTTTNTTNSMNIDPNCWNCPNQSLLPTDIFCTNCKIIQPIQNPLSTQTYFELYQLPIKYQIDQNLLEKKFHTFQRSLHPDLFNNKTPHEQEISSNYSIYINRSYDILKDDLLRAKYILYLQAPLLIAGDESKTDYEHLPPLHGHMLSNSIDYYPPYKSGLPQTELMSVLDYHEIIADSDNIDELMNVYKSIQIRMDEVKGDIGEYLDGNVPNYEKALESCEIYHYHRNLLKSLIPKIPSDKLNELH